MSLVEDQRDGEDYVPLSSETFETSSSYAEYSWCLAEDILSHVLQQVYNLIKGADLQGRILKYNSIASNIPANICLFNSTIETLEKRVKYVQS